mgnify:CR=1 FL=1
MNQKLNTMKKLLSFLFVFTLFSCGKDDDNVVNTFLSVYDGVGFYAEEPEEYEEDVYIFFNNSVDFLTQRDKINECISLREGLLSGYDGGNPTIEITVNTENRLEVLLIFTQGVDEEKFIFTVSGNNLNYIAQSMNDAGVFEDYMNWTLEKTSFTLSKVCDLPVL